VGFFYGNAGDSRACLAPHGGLGGMPARRLRTLLPFLVSLRLVCFAHLRFARRVSHAYLLFYSILLFLLELTCCGSQRGWCCFLPPAWEVLPTFYTFTGLLPLDSARGHTIAADNQDDTRPAWFLIPDVTAAAALSACCRRER